MARIAGVDLPKNKVVEIGLTAILELVTELLYDNWAWFVNCAIYSPFVQLLSGFAPT